MAKKKGDYPIPFDVHGSLLHYDGDSTGGYRDTATGEVFLRGVDFTIRNSDGSWTDYLNDDVQARIRQPSCRPHPVVWRDNFTFDDTLEWHTFNRGRSAAYLILKSVTTGVEYPMFLKNLDEAMRRGGFTGNRITGTWTFTKFGENYGIRLADEV